MFHGTIDLDAAKPVNDTAIPDALFERGLYWASGRGGLVDLVAAHKWFNLAAARGVEAARNWRNQLAGEMAPAQVAEAQRLAREWLKIAPAS